MITLVIYDIPETKVRNKVVEACKDFGLKRVQWSAFLGPLTYNRRQELELRLRRTLGRSYGNIQLFPLCDKDVSLRREIEGQSPHRYRPAWLEPTHFVYYPDSSDLGG